MTKMKHKYIIFFDVYKTSKGLVRGSGQEDIYLPFEISSSVDLDDALKLIMAKEGMDVLEAMPTNYKLISSEPVFNEYQGMSDQSNQSDM